jgi:hypothetical protein
MMMSVEQSAEWELARETEAFVESLPKCHFVHLKPHVTLPGTELVPPLWEADY